MSWVTPQACAHPPVSAQRSASYSHVMDAEPVTPSPIRPVERAIFSQSWCQLTFLHWAVPAERVVSYMPPGVRPDSIGGVSYVGLVPFLMRDIGVYGSPRLPYLGSFHETNVRLYSVDEKGRRGVVFVSLDASRLIPVLTARWGPGLPYLWSRMTYHRQGDRIRYTCRRRWPGPRGVSSTICVRVGEPITAGPLESFLTARWGLHEAFRRKSYYWPNAHQPWPLHAARLDPSGEFEDELLDAAGFGDLARRAPDSVLFSPGVDAIFGPRLPVR
jgi:uncharacterized protein